MCFNKLLLSTETICSGGVLNTCIVSLTILVSRSDIFAGHIHCCWSVA